MTERRRNSFAIFTASGRILAMLAGFLMPIFLTRYLSQENYGLYSQFNMLLAFMSSIFSFGIQSNLYFFYPGSNVERQKRLVGNTMFSMIALAFVAMVLLFIPFTAKLFVSDGKLLAFAKLVAIGIFFSVPVLMVFPLFVIKGDKTLSVLFPPLEALLRIAIIVITALVFNSIESILLAMVLYHFLQFAFVTIYASWPYRKVKGGWFDWDVLRSQFSYALPFGVAVVLGTLFRQFDKMLCISYITPAEYAVYSLAFYGIPGINQIYDSVAEVNILNMSTAYKEENVHEIISLAQRYVTRLMSFSVPIIMAAFLFADVFIEFLFPPQYMGAVPFFRIFIFSFIFGALGAGLVLRATGHTKYTLRAYLFSAVIYLPFAFVSIKFYGTWGAIFTAMLGVFLPKFFQIAYEVKILNLKVWQYLPWKQMGFIFLLSIVLLLPLVLCKFFFSINIVVALLMALVYVLLTYWIELNNNVFIVGKEVMYKWLHSIIKA